MTKETATETYEYRVVPAPRKGEKARGVKSAEARFALAMSRLFNMMGADGWEYVRADTLPSEERVGLTGKEVRYHALLVFRRAKPSVLAVSQLPREPAPRRLPPPSRQERQDWSAFADSQVAESDVIDMLSARARPRRVAE